MILVFILYTKKYCLNYFYIVTFFVVIVLSEVS